MFQKSISIIRTSAVQFQNLRYFYTTFGGIQVNHFGQLILKFDSQVTRCEKSRRKSDIILSLRIQDKTIMEKQQHMLLIVINHQSDQLKNRKFYKYSSANANFSKSSGKGHKTKGRNLKHLYGSLWTKPSEILAFMAISSTYCIPRTLMN